jgi:hypothetical protein
MSLKGSLWTDRRLDGGNGAHAGGTLITGEITSAEIPRHQSGSSNARSGETPTEEEDLAERKARQWALITRYDQGAQLVLMEGNCAVCSESIIRKAVLVGDMLVITPWGHHFAPKHPAVLKEEEL